MKSDKELQTDVMNELDWEPRVDPAEIGVAVKDGIVTLSGHVDTYPEKWAAERAAGRVSGVKAVVEEIDVKLPGIYERSDQDIARAAANVLDWNSYVPRDRVKVQVQGGWVTLSGEVDWRYQREAAGDAVRNLMGVRGLANDISIKPAVSPVEVKTKIEAALERSAMIDASGIKVTTKGAKVTLKGAVRSWAERDEAGRVAWSAPGVNEVVNEILVI
ncbi:MAG: BON domain-containing protein [Acidobacteriota bacterium]